MPNENLETQDCVQLCWAGGPHGTVLTPLAYKLFCIAWRRGQRKPRTDRVGGWDSVQTSALQKMYAGRHAGRKNVLPRTQRATPGAHKICERFLNFKPNIGSFTYQGKDSDRQRPGARGQNRVDRLKPQVLNRHLPNCLMQQRAFSAPAKGPDTCTTSLLMACWIRSLPPAS